MVTMSMSLDPALLPAFYDKLVPFAQSRPDWIDAISNALISHECVLSCVSGSVERCAIPFHAVSAVFRRAPRGIALCLGAYRQAGVLPVTFTDIRPPCFRSLLRDRTRYTEPAAAQLMSRWFSRWPEFPPDGANPVTLSLLRSEYTRKHCAPLVAVLQGCASWLLHQLSETPVQVWVSVALLCPTHKPHHPSHPHTFGQAALAAAALGMSLHPDAHEYAAASGRGSWWFDGRTAEDTLLGACQLLESAARRAPVPISTILRHLSVLEERCGPAVPGVFDAIARAFSLACFRGVLEGASRLPRMAAVDAMLREVPRPIDSSSMIGTATALFAGLLASDALEKMTAGATATCKIPDSLLGLAVLARRLLAPGARSGRVSTAESFSRAVVAWDAVVATIVTRINDGGCSADELAGISGSVEWPAFSRWVKSARSCRACFAQHWSPLFAASWPRGGP